MIRLHWYLDKSGKETIHLKDAVLVEMTGDVRGQYPVDKLQRLPPVLKSPQPALWSMISKDDKKDVSARLASLDDRMRKLKE